MIVNCAIVDDEPLALDLLESYIRKTPFLNLVGRYSSAIQAMRELPNQSVDLLFLDIQMPDLSGVDFSKMLPSDIRVIFTTAFSEYAADSYRVNALDYLLKPISYAVFLEASNKALNWFEMSRKSAEQTSNPAESDIIFIKSERRLVQINLNKLLYVEALKDYMKFVSEGDEMPVFSLMSLKSLEATLPSSRFMRVHRSFIVQKAQVKVVENNRIVFGKVRIPIGDAYKASFQEFLAECKL